MRYIFIIAIVALGLFAQEDKELEKIIEGLKSKNSVSLEKIEKNPFSKYTYTKSTTKESSKKEIVIEIQSIYNKKVLIDNVWYEEGESVYGKKIVYVGLKGIILDLGGTKREIVKLKTADESQGFKIGKSK